MKKKIAICWIGIGRYNELFEDFYCSFNEKFCLECERTFFIFTDTPSITDGLEDCITYTISHACKHVGFILFRKFKYLLMAEDKFLDYDYVIFCNGNMKCLREITFKEVDPGEKSISSILHPHDSASNMHISENRYVGSCIETQFNDWSYLQDGFFVAKSGFFLKMANQIESWRQQDKAAGVSGCIPWHDESYYNAFMHRNAKELRYLPYLIFNCPFDYRRMKCFRTHAVVPSAHIGIMTMGHPNGAKGKYETFKDDLY